MEEIFISSAVASTTALLLGLLATGLLVFKSCKGASVQSILRYFLPNPTIQIETIRVHPVKACRGFEVDSWFVHCHFPRCTPSTAFYHPQYLMTEI